MNDLKKVDKILDTMDKFLEDSANIPGKLDEIANRLSKLERCNRTSETILHNFDSSDHSWIPIIDVGTDGDSNGLFCVNIKSTSQGWEYLMDMSMVLDEPTPIRIITVKENHKSIVRSNSSVDNISELNVDMVSFRLVQDEASCGGTIYINIPNVGNVRDSLSVCIVDGPKNINIIDVGQVPSTVINIETMQSSYVFSVAKHNTVTYWYGIESMNNLTLVSHEMTSCISDSRLPLRQIQKVTFTIYDRVSDQFITISEDHNPATEILTGNILLDRNDMCTINYTVTELDKTIVLMMMVTLGDYSYNSDRFELHKVEFNLYRGINNEYRT